LLARRDDIGMFVILARKVLAARGGAAKEKAGL